MQELYKQRHNFAVLGLTGRSGAGCSEVASKLSEKNYIAELQKCANFKNIINELSDFNREKIDICLTFLSNGQNWQPFTIIKYTNVILYLIFLEAKNKFDNNEEKILNLLINLVCSGNGKVFKRFGKKHISSIEIIIKKSIKKFNKNSNIKPNSLESLLDKKNVSVSENELFIDFATSETVLNEFTKSLEQICLIKTKLFFHDMAIQFREKGSLFITHNDDDKKIFFIAQIINRLIKGLRVKEKHGRVVIDSIKNSLELSFFQSRYAAFYCIATNKIADERYEYKTNKYPKTNKEELIEFDETEFKGKDVSNGDFSAPDVENCIQKSGYHIFYSNDFDEYSEVLSCKKQSQVCLDLQIIKFLALLNHPGIVTPTAIERNMQIAFTSKANSGCISRQVGAVVTDQYHTVKAVGWNDVAAGQMPCNLRNINDLINNNKPEYFSSFEKGNLPLGTYTDKGTFKQQVSKHLKENNIDQSKLKGRNCSYCFKTFHNVFEGKANQVHTRSLHAEENAMLQLTKYGGTGIKNGKLYTTASPCELCSKKAFQLGIKTIFYIDPYPGIATNHILKSSKDPKDNPKLVMFQGAVGKAYHRLYDPFLSYKDELNILIDLHPEMNQDRIISKLTDDTEKQQEIRTILQKKP